MSRPTTSRISCLLALLALTGCGSWDPLRLDPVPELDCRVLFPELEKATDDEEPRGPSPFAQDLARRTGWPAAGESSAADKRLLVLAGRFVGELPSGAGGTWRSLAGHDVTLLTHSPDGGRQDVLLYAEAFSPLMATRPSEDLARFELTVDPGLLDEQLTWPAVTTAWVDSLEGGRKERAGMRRLARMAATRTGGRGFGYASSPRAFSGWKWVGRNRQDVFLRLARSEGEWGGQQPLDPELEKLLPRVVQRSPRLSWLVPADQVEPRALGAPVRGAVPASMVFGTATTPEGGIHLAVLCACTPVCATADQLASFLSSLRRAGPGEVDLLLADIDTSSSIEAFAADLGFAIAPQDGLLRPRTSPSP